jgi:hypothetical protein
MGEMKEGSVGRRENFLGDNVENMSHFVFSRVIPFLILPPPLPQREGGKTRELAPTAC